MSSIYEKVSDFTNRYPASVAFRLRRHCSVIEKHLNANEEVKYAFCGQHNNSPTQIFDTCVVAITNERILVAQKRVFFGYLLTSVTPDLYNDMEVISNIIWATVVIDTVKETIYISNLSKRALKEIETNITENMMEAKKSYKGSN